MRRAKFLFFVIALGILISPLVFAKSGEQGISQLILNSGNPIENSPIVSALGSGATSTPESNFVQRQGSRLILNDKTFYFSGANAHHLFFQSDDTIEAILNQAQDLKINVIRIWGFCDGYENAPKYYNETSGEWEWITPSLYGENRYPFPNERIVFQPNQTNRFDHPVSKNAFAKLDFIIQEASARGIKLIIALVNNWADFGGMNHYVNVWDTTADEHDDFYSKENCRTYYRTYLEYVLHKYKNEPTILAWELANEPRVMSGGDDEDLGIEKYGDMKKWVNEMASYAKQYDPNHLISVGCEGYDMEWLEEFNSYGGSGLDLAGSSYIDLVSFHFYPDFSDPLDGYATEFNTIEYIYRRIKSSIKQLNKPAYIGEFGVAVRRGCDKETLFSFNEENKECGWQASAGFSSALWIDEPSFDGNGSLKLKTDGAVKQAEAKMVIDPLYFAELADKEYISAYVHLPDGSPKNIKARIFVVFDSINPQYGSNIWSGGQEYLLTPKERGTSEEDYWTRIYLDRDEVESFNPFGLPIYIDPLAEKLEYVPVEMNRVKAIGIKVRAVILDDDVPEAEFYFNGDVYLDLVEAFVGDTEEEMGHRNIIFEKVYNEVYATDGAGAICWQILPPNGNEPNHREDKFGIYPGFDDDQETVDIIKHFSDVMQAKCGLPVFAWKGAEQEEFDVGEWGFEDTSDAINIEGSGDYHFQGLLSAKGAFGPDIDRAIFFNGGPKSELGDVFGLREDWTGKKYLLGLVYVPEDGTASRCAVAVSTMEPLRVEEGDEDPPGDPHHDRFYEWKYPPDPDDPTKVKWDWFESKPKVLRPGTWNFICEPLDQSTWLPDIEGYDEYDVSLSNPNQVQQASLKILHSHAGYVFDEFEYCLPEEEDWGPEIESSGPVYYSTSDAKEVYRNQKNGFDWLVCVYNGEKSGHAFYKIPITEKEEKPDYWGIDDWSRKNEIQVHLVPDYPNSGAHRIKFAFQTAKIEEDGTIDPDNTNNIYYESNYQELSKDSSAIQVKSFPLFDKIWTRVWEENGQMVGIGNTNPTADELTVIRMAGFDIRHNKLGSDVWDPCNEDTLEYWDIVPAPDSCAETLTVTGGVFKLDYSDLDKPAQYVRKDRAYGLRHNYVFTGLLDDWTRKNTVKFDLFVPEEPEVGGMVSATIALQTGDDWHWEELKSQAKTIEPGNYYEALDFNISRVPNLNKVQALALVFKRAGGGEDNPEWYDEGSNLPSEWSADVRYTDALDVVRAGGVLKYRHNPAGFASFKRDFVDGSEDGSKDWTNKTEVIANINAGVNSGATEAQLALLTGPQGNRKWFYSEPKALNDLRFNIQDDNWSLEVMDGPFNQGITRLDKVKVAALLIRHRVPLGVGIWDDCAALDIPYLSGGGSVLTTRHWLADTNQEHWASDATTMNAATFAEQSVFKLEYLRCNPQQHSSAYYYIPTERFPDDPENWSLDNNWERFSTATIKAFVPEGVPTREGTSLLWISLCVVTGELGNEEDANWYCHLPVEAKFRGTNLNTLTIDLHDSNWRDSHNENYNRSIQGLSNVKKVGILVMHPYDDAGTPQFIYLDKIELSSAIGGPGTANVAVNNIGVYPREGEGGGGGGGSEDPQAGSLYVRNVQVLPRTGNLTDGQVCIDKILAKPSIDNTNVYIDDFRLYSNDVLGLTLEEYFLMHAPIVDVWLDKAIYYAGETAELSLMIDNLARPYDVPFDITIIKEQPGLDSEYLVFNAAGEGEFVPNESKFWSVEDYGPIPSWLTVKLGTEENPFVTFVNNSTLERKGVIHAKIEDHNTGIVICERYFHYEFSSQEAPPDEGRADDQWREWEPPATGSGIGQEQGLGEAINRGVGGALGFTPPEITAFGINKSIFYPGDDMILSAVINNPGAERDVDFHLACQIGDRYFYVHNLDPLTIIERIPHPFRATLPSGITDFSNFVTIAIPEVDEVTSGFWHLVITKPATNDVLALSDVSFTVKVGGIGGGGNPPAISDFRLNRYNFYPTENMKLSAVINNPGAARDVDFHLACQIGDRYFYVHDLDPLTVVEGVPHPFRATLPSGPTVFNDFVYLEIPNVTQTTSGIWHLVITRPGTTDTLALNEIDFTVNAPPRIESFAINKSIFYPDDDMVLSANIFNPGEQRNVDFHLACEIGGEYFYVTNLKPLEVSDQPHPFRATLPSGTTNFNNFVTITIPQVDEITSGSWHLVITKPGKNFLFSEASVNFTVSVGGLGYSPIEITRFALNKSIFYPGDNMILSARVENPNSPKEVDFHLACEIEGEYFYVTNFNPLEVSSNPHPFRVTLPRGVTNLDNFVTIAIPPVDEISHGSWHLVITEPGTNDTLELDDVGFTIHD